MWDYYWTYYIMGIILLPGLLLAAYAQTKVSNSFGKYSQVVAKCGITASQLVRSLLDSAKLYNINVVKVGGNLTDYYDSKNKVIALSDKIHDSTSIAALGIATHEFGHALQDANKYVPYKIRQFMIPVAQFLSTLMWPLVIVGLVLNLGVFIPSVGNIVLIIGSAFFGLAVLINLVTLPVEYNASRQATVLLKKGGVLDAEELDGAKKVLSAAAFTYVAALITSILSLLRFVLTILLFSSRRRK